MKNNQNLAKLAILSFTALTLVASGTTGDTGDTEGTTTTTTTTITTITIPALTGKHAFIKINGGAETVGKANVKFVEDGKHIFFTRDDKIYEFTAAEFDESNKSYTLTDGTEKVQLQNLSTGLLQADKNYTTSDVNVWWADINDTTVKFHDQGYFVVGNKSSSIPTSSTTGFAGGLVGAVVSKFDSGELTMTADAAFVADFGTQKISGGFSNFVFENSEGTTANGTDNLNIVDVTISGTGFSGTLEGTGAGSFDSSSLEGAFYGDEAGEMGGIGQFEDADAVGTFGFTATK